MTRGDSPIKRVPTGNVPPELIYSKGRLPPNWRWRIANGSLRLVTGQVAAEREPYVVQARKFFRDLKERNKDMEDLASRYPAIREAYLIETENAVDKWLLQALIVGKASPEDMAFRTGLEMTTIDWYEKLFYDVGNVLGNGFKFIKLVPQAVGGILLKTDHDPLWKIVAFSGGVAMLDAFVTPGPISDSSVGWFRSASRGSAARNQFIAETGRDINKHTQRFILEQATETRKVEIVAQTSGVDVSDSPDKGRQFLSGLQMSVASVLDQQREGNEEPRDHELIKEHLMLPSIPSTMDTPEKTE